MVADSNMIKCNLGTLWLHPIVRWLPDCPSSLQPGLHSVTSTWPTLVGAGNVQAQPWSSWSIGICYGNLLTHASSNTPRRRQWQWDQEAGLRWRTRFLKGVWKASENRQSCQAGIWCWVIVYIDYDSKNYTQLGSVHIIQMINHN